MYYNESPCNCLYYNSNEIGAESPDQYARGIMIQAWKDLYGREPTLAERQLSQAVGRLETYYGRAGQFKGSHNWGAVQHSRPKDGQCPPGSFLGRDSMDGTKKTEYAICERSYGSDLEGATHMLKILSRTPQEKEALQSGSAGALARAMKAAGYYGISAANYQKAIFNNAKDIAKNCGENLAVSWDGSTSSSSETSSGSTALVVLAVAAGAGFLLLNKRRTK